MRAYGAHSESVLWHLIGQALGGTFGVHGLQNCFHSTSAGTFGVHGLLNPLQSTPPHELLRNRRFYKGKVDILKRKLSQYFSDSFQLYEHAAATISPQKCSMAPTGLTLAATFGVHRLQNPLHSTAPHELLRNCKFYIGKVYILKRKLSQYFLDFFQ